MEINEFIKTIFSYYLTLKPNYNLKKGNNLILKIFLLIYHNYL